MKTLCTLFLLLALSVQAQITISNATLSGVTSGSALLATANNFTASNTFSGGMMIWGDANKTNGVLISPAGEVLSNAVGSVTIAGGNVTASGNIISSNFYTPNNTAMSKTLILGNGGTLNTTNSPFTSDTSGNFNTGVHAGDGNLFVGIDAGSNNLSGQWNTYLGTGAGWFNTFGDQNVFVGHWAGHYNTNGYHNTYLGNEAGEGWTNGNYNTFLGCDTGPNAAQAQGNNNVLVGDGVAFSAQDVIGLALVGSGSGNAITTGGWNTALGLKTLYNLTTGSNNVAIGRSAGYAGASPANVDSITDYLCTFLGYYAARDGSSSAQLTDSTALGANSAISASHQVVLGSTTTTQVVSTGVFTGNGSGLTNLYVMKMAGGACSGAGNLGTVTRFMPFFGGASVSATEANVSSTLTFGCTITNLYIKMQSSIGAGTNVTFYVYTNGVQSLMTVSLNANGSTATVGADTTHGLTLTNGSTVSLSYIGNNAVSMSSGSLFNWTFSYY